MSYYTTQINTRKSRQLTEARRAAYLRASVAVGLVVANVWAAGVR